MTKKQVQKAEVKKENAVVLAKNAQIKSLSKIVEQQAALIEDLTDQIKVVNHQSTEEKIFDMVSQFLMGNVKAQSPLPAVEQKGQGFQSILSQLPPETIGQLAGLSLKQFAKVAKQQYPTASDEQIESAFKQVQAMV